jgi:predicted nucleic-acid-binding Zn-ribbon protein
MKLKNYDEVQRAITEKIGEIQCPICKNQSVQLDEYEYYRISYEREGEHLVPIHTHKEKRELHAMSYVTLKCHHCGYLMDFSLSALMNDSQYPKR